MNRGYGFFNYNDYNNNNNDQSDIYSSDINSLKRKLEKEKKLKNEINDKIYIFTK